MTTVKLRVAVGVIAFVGFAALVVNWLGGIEGRCSDEGWSGCGWTYQLSGWLVVACLAGLLGLGLVALGRRFRRP
jgi:hypothetical protein